jgi:hypothetical protein
MYSGVHLPERTINLKIEEAFADLKDALVKKGAKVVSENAPKQLVVKQGSLWGVAPKSAKKTVTATLTPTDSGTKIAYSSKLSSDWKNITIVGCVLAAVLVAVCLWTAKDLSTFMVTRQPSFWSWLIAVGSTVNVQAGQAFVNLA